MRAWTITAKAGWLAIEDETSITCVDAKLITCFGTTSHGFVVNTAAETMFFEAVAEHARHCVKELADLLAVT